MKALSGVLNTFKTVSGGFLNSNKFKLLFIWQPWAVRQLTYILLFFKAYLTITQMNA